MATISKTKIKEQRIKNYQSKFDVKFDMSDAVIDLRTMANNYPNGIIPNKDIGEAVSAVLGPSSIPRLSVDPRRLAVPKFEWVAMDDIAINPKFQRDVMPSHIAKIEAAFQADTIIVPCAVKDPVSGLYLFWDGHHTGRVCERMGWSHLPVWFTEAQIDDEHSIEQAIKILISHAGNSMIAINDIGKRPLSRYDKHMISVECLHTEPVIIQNIVDTADCQVKRTGSNPGDISHIEHLYGSYSLVQPSSGIKGIYLARSLKFHRQTWPMEEVRGIMMLAMARLYQQTETQTGVFLPQEFDVEFGEILRNLYGFSDAVHDESSGLKSQYIQHFGSLAGHPEVVTSGLILTFNKHGSNKYRLAQPESTYPVK